jgi:hypothetical protein
MMLTERHTESGERQTTGREGHEREGDRGERERERKRERKKERERERRFYAGF